MYDNLVKAADAALQRAQVQGALLLGVSGGMDSVVLAHALCSLAAPRRLEIHIAHFDHALRPTSAEEAHFVAQLAAAWGLPFHTARWAHGDFFPAGMEAAARAARYAFLAAIARMVALAGQQPCMVVAHHADDHAETLLLNLMRGSGLHGLAAMRMASLWEADGGRPVQLLRPLLRTPRSELAAYAAAHTLTWREDESNDDRDQTRNFVRHAVLPLMAQRNPAIVDTLARTAHLLAQEADRLLARDAELLAPATVESIAGTRLLLRYAALQEASWGDRCALLRAGLRSTFAPQTLGMVHIEALAAALAEPPRATGPHSLVDDIVWSIVYDGNAPLLSLHRAHGLPLEPQGPWLDDLWRAAYGALPLAAGDRVLIAGGWALDLLPVNRCIADSPPDPWSLCLDIGAGNGLCLTTPHAGLRIAPLGMGGHRRSLGNIFTDRRIAPALRPGWPIIANASGQLLWLCGLVVAEGVQAQPGAQALLLRWVHNPG